MATQEEWANLFNRTQGVPQASSGGVWGAIDSIPTRINSAADRLAGSIDTARASIAPENITRNIDSALSPLSRIGSRATNALSETANVISQDVVGNGFNAIRNANPDNIIHSVGSTLSSIPSGVKEFARDIASGINPNGIITAVKTGLRSARDAIGETASMGMSTIGTAGRTLGRGIETEISNTFSAIGSVGRGFLDASNGYEFNSGNRFERFGSTIGNGYREALDAFSSGMSSIGSRISSEASSLRKRITSFPGTAANKLGSIRKNISTGIDNFRNLNPSTIINGVINKKTENETNTGGKDGSGDATEEITQKKEQEGNKKSFSERIRNRFGNVRKTISNAFSDVGKKISDIKRPHLPSLPSLPSLNIGGKLSSVKDNISTAIGNTKTAISNRFSRSSKPEGGETGGGSGGKTSDIEKPSLFSRIRDHFSPGKDDYGNYSDIKKAWKKSKDSDDARIERFSSVAQSRKEAFEKANQEKYKDLKGSDREKKLFNDFIESERGMLQGNDKKYMKAYGSFLDDTKKQYEKVGEFGEKIDTRRKEFSENIKNIKNPKNIKVEDLAAQLGSLNTSHKGDLDTRQKDRQKRILNTYEERAQRAINEEKIKNNKKSLYDENGNLRNDISKEDKRAIKAKQKELMIDSIKRREERYSKINSRAMERQGHIANFESDAIAGHKVGNGHFKGKVGAVVGLLALGGIIGNQFAGGHQTNAQLYNPSPQPQYYS